MEQHNYQEQKQWAVADIEVTMVDSHANMKILSKKKPGQLMKIVVGLQNLRLTIFHLNVTTVDDMVLYSVSIKVEEGSQLNSVDEIAAAVNRLLRTVQQELAYQLN
uniref:Plant bHLH transcription factor ACT-like domain-containing protein n=1 Tax=Medicago truncatula TaxID=3880 RepID=I3SQU8_MEDTR|nr:unknown [Medicago truncatula]